MKYNYFYKITNQINNHFYYGIHSTDNLNDGYIGSGTALHKAYAKYGIENFKKEILKYFDTRKELSEYEKQIVTEDLVLNPNCYNISCGGETFNTLSSVSVKDKDGNCFRCPKNDPKYISGEYISVAKDFIRVYDTIEDKFLSINKKYYDNNRYKNISECFISVKHKNIDEDYFLIKREDYDKSIYEHYATNKVLCKDINNSYFIVDKNDNRLITGELILYWVGKHHTGESIKKLKNTFTNIKHQQGSKNSQYGKVWIYNKELDKSLSINKSKLDTYLNSGWIKGRKIKDKTNIIIANQSKTWINKDGKTLFIYKDKLIDYLNNGWNKGRK